MTTLLSKAFEKSQKQLEKLAEKALSDFAHGKVTKKGF